ncbi:MAG: VWA domain-containing protein [Clostridia bacterium]
MGKKSRKFISSILVFSIIIQFASGLFNVKVVEAAEKSMLKITKEDIIKDNKSNTISFKIKVKNEGEEEVDLANLKLSYWYSDNSIDNEVIKKDWMSINSTDVLLDLEKLKNEHDKANSKINITFKQEINKLKKSDEIELNIRLENKEWKDYDQENNHSFSNGITAEYNNKLIYGNRPSELKPSLETIKIDARMYNKEIKKSATSIYPWISVINTGNINLDLSKLELRYYYTGDNEKGIKEEYAIDWANIGKDKVKGAFETVKNIKDADRYFSLKFNTDGKLKKGEEIEMHTRFNKNDWSNYNQQNDYSFNKESKDYIKWDKLLVFYDGQLISGDEPEVDDGIPTINLEGKRVKNTIALKWDEVKDLDKYVIERGTDPNKLEILENEQATNLYFDNTDKKLESKYFYRVLAYKNKKIVAKSKKIAIDSFIDTDNDNLIDDEEKKLGTDMRNEDTDGDGLLDGEEVLKYKTNPLVQDTDGDGLNDLYEVYISGTNPLKKDTDGNNILDGEEDVDKDGLSTKEEMKVQTNPNEMDSDFDGLNDKEEINNYKTEPNSSDTDVDGINDGIEVNIGTNPNSKDTNNNGILDGDETFEYIKEPKEVDMDGKIDVKVEGDFLGKHIDNSSIVNTEGTNVMTSDSTPGYIGSPYLINIPNGTKNIKVVFEINKEILDNKMNPRIYKLDKTNNKLIEVENQNKISDNIIEMQFKDSKEDKSPSSDILTESDMKVNDNYIIIDKNAWDKYWENEIKHPLEKGKLDLSFVIDTSGSMSSNDRNKYRVKLAEHFIGKKQDEDRFALIGFSDYASVYQSLTDNKEKLLKNVKSLGLNSGGTNIHDGLQKGLMQLKDSEGRDKKIILLTDGQGTFHDSILDEANKDNVKIFTIGLGDSYNKDLLQKIADKTGGKYYHVKNEDEFGNIIDDIHGDTGDADIDNDGIPDDEDDDKLSSGIVLEKYSKSDETLLQAADLAYEKTDICQNKACKDKKCKNKEVGHMKSSKANDMKLIDDWKVIKSHDSTWFDDGGADSGFGAVAIKKGNNIIISYEGTAFGKDFLLDVVFADLIGIVSGGPCMQLYKAYQFANDLMNDFPQSEIYMTGHSLGGWLANKVFGTMLDADMNINNQLPAGNLSNSIKQISNSFKENNYRIKKVVPFAAPGFVSETRILGTKYSEFRKKLFNYKIDTDPVSLFGFDNILRGNVKFLDGKKYKLQWEIFGFGGHLTKYYYKHKNDIFSNVNTYNVDTIDTKNKDI